MEWYADEELVFILAEEPEWFTLKVQTSEIDKHHVEEFMDTTVEWLSTNPRKGIVIDFAGVKAICADFAIQLASHYEKIKARGLNVRFVNVAPSIEPYIDVSNITMVVALPVLKKPKLSTRAILEDLARNLSDDELMTKHGISRRGLSSMFRKLLHKGLVTREVLAKRMGVAHDKITIMLDVMGSDELKVSVDAAAVLKDIAENMTDEDLMHKYRLSPKGLESLMRKLYKKNLVSKDTLLLRKQLIE